MQAQLICKLVVGFKSYNSTPSQQQDTITKKKPTISPQLPDVWPDGVEVLMMALQTFWVDVEKSKPMADTSTKINLFELIQTSFKN